MERIMGKKGLIISLKEYVYRFYDSYREIVHAYPEISGVASLHGEFCQFLFPSKPKNKLTLQEYYKENNQPKIVPEIFGYWLKNNVSFPYEKYLINPIIYDIKYENSSSFEFSCKMTYRGKELFFNSEADAQKYLNEHGALDYYLMNKIESLYSNFFLGVAKDCLGDVITEYE